MAFSHQSGKDEADVSVSCIISDAEVGSLRGSGIFGLYTSGADVILYFLGNIRQSNKKTNRISQQIDVCYYIVYTCTFQPYSAVTRSRR